MLQPNGSPIQSPNWLFAEPIILISYQPLSTAPELRGEDGAMVAIFLVALSSVTVAEIAEPAVQELSLVIGYNFMAFTTEGSMVSLNSTVMEVFKGMS